MRSPTVFVIVLMLGSHSGLGHAHHSATIYQPAPMELEGELLEVNWRNPHVSFRLRTVDESGAEVVWSMEAHSIFNLQRGGVTRELFPVGERVTVVGRQSTLVDRRMLATNMWLPDGHELLLWTNVVSQFDDASKLRDTAAENLGIFRVWTLEQSSVLDAIFQVNEQPFTEEALAARGSWDPLDNFTTRCEAEGMPRMMLTPYPVEFIDDGDRIIVRTEYFDIVRTIHMNRPEAPEKPPLSHLGYSVGHWQGGTLVVETTRIDWPYIDNRGTPLSTAVDVVERFTLSNDQGQLDLHMTVTDPATFTEPAILVTRWLALGDTVGRFDTDCN